MKHTHTAIVQLSADTLLYRYGRRREGESSPQLAQDKKHDVDIGEVSDLAAQATRALARTDLTSLQQLGQLLYNRIIPGEVSKYLSSQPTYSDLVFDLDPEISGIPWELLFDGTAFLCRRFRVSRLLVKTGEELEVAMRRDVLTGPGKVLVLRGDVSGLASERELESIQRILLPAVGEDNFVVRSADTKDEGMGLLTEGYDICHFIGHGEFSKQHPEDSGWKFPKGKVLTCSEIEQITSPGAIFPRLIIANCCDSARSGDTGPEAFVSALYHSFLSRGVQHYIGTIGRVPDYASQVFSQSFYEAFASGRSIGEALFAAREVTSTGIGWAFYVHYGDPGFSPLASISRQGRLTLATSEPDVLETIVTQRRQTGGVHVRRSREMNLARYHVGLFAPDYAGVVLLGGESGVGKSECLTDMLGELRSSVPDAICGVTACREGGSEREYAAIKELLLSIVLPHPNVTSVNNRALYAMRRYPQLRNLARLDLLISQPVPTHAATDLPALGRLDPGLVHRELRSFVTDLLTTHPVIIALEDLQYADELSRELFFGLLFPRFTGRLLLFGTYRSHEVSDSLNARLTDAAVRGCQVLEMDFSDTAVAYLDRPAEDNRVRTTEAFVIRYLKKASPISSRERFSFNLVRSLIRCTAGNGLLLSEIIRKLRERDYLVRVSGRFCQIWELRKSIDTNVMTDRMLAWIKDRVASLDDLARKILMHASVVGFNVKTLGKLLEIDPLIVFGALERLETFHRLLDRSWNANDYRRNVEPMVYDKDEASTEEKYPGFYFRHGILRGYFETLLGPRLRPKLHNLFGEYLEEVCAEISDDIFTSSKYYKT